MTDDEIRQYLEDCGYPAHVVRAGRAGLIEAWEKFVEQVESGYRLGLDDYRNDLDLRGIIGQIGAEDQVRDCDERLKALLVNTDSRIWDSSSPDDFWVYGYPANAGEAMMEDLRAEGLAV